MPDYIETQDLSLNLDSEPQVLKSLGISPRIPNKSLSPKHFLSNPKTLSKVQRRKESPTLTSQRLFQYCNPYQSAAAPKVTSRVSVGFFMNNQFKGKVVNSAPREVEMGDSRRTGVIDNFRLRSSSVQEKEIAHATYSIGRLLKMREKLRKSSLISQELIDFHNRKSGSPPRNSVRTEAKEEYERSKSTKRNSSYQKYQLLKSLKKGEMIRRKRHSGPEPAKGIILSYRSSESSGPTHPRPQLVNPQRAPFAPHWTSSRQ